MDPKRVPHPDDAADLQLLREKLRQIRLARGQTLRELSKDMESKTFLSRMENATTPSPMVAGLQMWAATLDVRIEFSLEGFWLFTHHDDELLKLHHLSRAWGADVEMRRWLVTALRHWRARVGMDVDEVGPLLNTDGEGVWAWEIQPNPNPLIGRAMWQARVTGTRVLMQVYTREQWIFDR